MSLEWKMLLQEQPLLWKGGNTEKAPAGVDTTAAVWKYREGSHGSRHHCGSVKIQRKLVLGGKIEKGLLRKRSLLRQCGNTEKLLLEWTLLRQCGNTEKVSGVAAGKTEKTPAGTDAAAAVWEFRKGSCGSRHCYGSEEIQRRPLQEQSLRWQWENEENRREVGTAVAVGG
ncbi:hypothetical protein ROHU_008433 [Labeo rohita]|uniref:Uncharacterized protein n=1 Tax=Labeo rohita TaxID=84645 RepID=A0A498MH42_LABRO|nr:hypothetical protein ROHU_008433 [Labeo rohita]